MRLHLETRPAKDMSEVVVVIRVLSSFALPPTEPAHGHLISLQSGVPFSENVGDVVHRVRQCDVQLPSSSLVAVVPVNFLAGIMQNCPDLPICDLQHLRGLLVAYFSMGLQKTSSPQVESTQCPLIG